MYRRYVATRRCGHGRFCSSVISVHREPSSQGVSTLFSFAWKRNSVLFAGRSVPPIDTRRTSRSALPSTPRPYSARAETLLRFHRMLARRELRENGVSGNPGLACVPRSTPGVRRSSPSGSVSWALIDSRRHAAAQSTPGVVHSKRPACTRASDPHATAARVVRWRVGASTGSASVGSCSVPSNVPSSCSCPTGRKEKPKPSINAVRSRIGKVASARTRRPYRVMNRDVCAA